MREHTQPTPPTSPTPPTGRDPAQGVVINGQLFLGRTFGGRAPARDAAAWLNTLPGTLGEYESLRYRIGTVAKAHMAVAPEGGSYESAVHVLAECYVSPLFS